MKFWRVHVEFGQKTRDWGGLEEKILRESWWGITMTFGRLEGGPKLCSLCGASLGLPDRGVFLTGASRGDLSCGEQGTG